MRVIVTYTVLARKWRPKNFSELVGQSHVMQALSNALDQKRLHHAYLFTGTRGVGKTTIARIFAKALNCEQGITSSPCGDCVNCVSINEGRFVDLIEVDAASKTKVDDTRELLDNVQYAAVQGRYKVYLIDEVHMLSKSSFNALLKTLEEPPEHVKFLLATTDPHKLPMTVLSRCLQFNLMRLTTTQIQDHLSYILQQERVPFEEAALAMIAKSADGSARDALSILDQAIAFGAGQVNFEPVQAMLGLVDQQFTSLLLQALVEESASLLKDALQQLASMGVDYTALLAQMIEVLHQVSLMQVLGSIGEAAVLEETILQGFADDLTPQRTQMLYQIALLGRQDMNLAPDERIGFEMAMLRMLAFVPVAAAQGNSGLPNKPLKLPGVVKSSVNSVAVPVAKVENEYSFQENPAALLKQQFANRKVEEVKKVKSVVKEPIQEYDLQEVTEKYTGKSHLEDLQKRLKETLGKPKCLVDEALEKVKEKTVYEPKKNLNFEIKQQSLNKGKERQSLSSDLEKIVPVRKEEGCLPIEVWLDLLKQIKPEGMAESLANQSILLNKDEHKIILSVDPSQKSSQTSLAVQRLQEAISSRFGADVLLEFASFKGAFLTPYKHQQNQNNNELKNAVESIANDIKVKEFISSLNMTIIESSIKPR